MAMTGELKVIPSFEKKAFIKDRLAAAAEFSLTLGSVNAVLNLDFSYTGSTCNADNPQGLFIHVDVAPKSAFLGTYLDKLLDTSRGQLDFQFLMQNSKVLDVSVMRILLVDSVNDIRRILHDVIVNLQQNPTTMSPVFPSYITALTSWNDHCQSIRGCWTASKYLSSASSDFASLLKSLKSFTSSMYYSLQASLI
jgi:hypothetical protein